MYVSTVGQCHREGTMKTEDLVIEGMTCGHCVLHVKNALGKLAGVQVVSVEIGKGRVQYDETRVSRRDFAKAIEQAGYHLVAQ